MSSEKITINRPLVGVLTIACFVGAGSVYLWLPSEELWLSGFIRVGLLMSAFWLALPTKSRPAAWAKVSPWTLAALIVGMILLPRYPRLVIPAAIAITIAAMFLRPRKPRAIER